LADNPPNYVGGARRDGMDAGPNRDTYDPCESEGWVGAWKETPGGIEHPRYRANTVS